MYIDKIDKSQLLNDLHEATRHRTKGCLIIVSSRVDEEFAGIWNVEYIFT